MTYTMRSKVFRRFRWRHLRIETGQWVYHFNNFGELTRITWDWI